MGKIVLGVLVGAGFVVAFAGVWDHSTPVWAQRATPYRESGPESGLIALQSPALDNGQLVTVIEPKQQVMSVYRVDAGTGKIKLLSVRNIHWDLQMMQLNSDNPLPQEIKSLLEQK